jgi:hypothetical protein
MTNESHVSNAPVVRALLIAGALVGAAVTLRVLTPSHLSPDLARRMMGVLLGVIVMVYANAVPKALSPLMQIRCEVAEEQAIRRFTGWSLVLGGMAFALAWLVAPIERANLIAGTALGVALFLALVRFTWGMARGPRA